MSNNKIDWTKSLTSKLIELWEERPCLYDPKSKYYANKHARVDALTQIAALLSEGEMEVSPEEIKKKINNIRSQFNHELTKRRETHSGMSTDDLYEPSVWWFKKVQFLEQFIKIRKSRSNFKASCSQNIMEMTNGSQDCDGDTQTQLSINNYDEVPSTSSSTAEPIFVKAPSAKRFKKANLSEDDVIINQTLTTLERINASHEKIIQQTSGSANAEFAKFITKELDSIDDEELLNEVKFEVHNVLYTYRKRYIERRKSEHL